MIYQVRRSKVDEIVGKLKKDPTNLYLLQEEFFIDEVFKSESWFWNYLNLFKRSVTQTHIWEKRSTQPKIM